jgi:hypothetical protein
MEARSNGREKATLQSEADVSHLAASCLNTVTGD